MDYSLKWPNGLGRVIQKYDGDIEISEIHSKRLFKLWSKFFKKISVKVPEIRQQKAEILPKSSCIDNEKKWIWFSRPNFGGFERNDINLYEFHKEKNQIDNSESNFSDTNIMNLSSRVLDKDECQYNYSLINKRMRNKVKNIQLNRHMLNKNPALKTKWNYY